MPNEYESDSWVDSPDITALSQTLIEKLGRSSYCTKSHRVCSKGADGGLNKVTAWTRANQAPGGGALDV